MLLIDLSGQRRGNITIIKRVPTVGRSRGTYWLLRCDCGNEIEDCSSNLNSGNRKTCGTQCPFHLARVRHGRAPGESGLVQAWNLCRRRALRKGKNGIEFTITQKEAFGFFQSVCHYCGCPPANIAKSNTEYGKCFYSGLDRIDSTQGYVKGNIVPCCWNCNRMKGSLSYDAFFSHIKKILQRRERNT